MTIRKVQINVRLDETEVSKIDEAIKQAYALLPSAPSKNTVIESWILEGLNRLKQHPSDSWLSDMTCERLVMLGRMGTREDIFNFQANLSALVAARPKLWGGGSGKPVQRDIAEGIFEILEHASSEANKSQTNEAMRSLGLALLHLEMA